jgi:hypothetical protein
MVVQVHFLLLIAFLNIQKGVYGQVYRRLTKSFRRP